ncbi:hypothetical protein CRG98_043803 [Punica granatum]|uniref:RAB6-interacting golgin n=1 Tax=Punica granatum TaxID=22663 RepID=A0A2I0HVQ8_PUNGR|nr:hypothetical protein CRG98_043803 [Punica granatum]
MASNRSLLPEIGPDGLAREASVIAYTEKIIEEEQLQLKKYIEENYSKIRGVERELANLTMEMKLTAGPKKAALELLRKKIESSTERIHVAKQKEEQARKVWEAASKALQDEEAIKQKLCEDLNNLDGKLTGGVQNGTVLDASSVPQLLEPVQKVMHQERDGKVLATNGPNQQPTADGDGRGKKKVQLQGRGKGIGVVPKGRGSSSAGWTGAGFDVDGRP